MKTQNTMIVRQATLILMGTLLFGSMFACAQAKPVSGTATKGTARVSAQPDPAKTALLQPLQQMVTKLKKLQATGDPDFDYAFVAKIHAQGEQDFLKQALLSGKDSSMKQMAQTLIAGTQADITMLDGTLRQIKPSRPNQAFTQQQSRNIEAINLKLQQTGASDKLTSDVDKNAVALLSDHQQDAIDMATTYLQYGKNTALRTYAQQLVEKAQSQRARLGAMPK
ncbi:DUF305 domain-containing protein [Spirosoma arcticum]